MARVEFGKVWKVTTLADLVTAWDALDENEFSAKMSDDSAREARELDEVARQRKQAARAARDSGII